MKFDFGFRANRSTFFQDAPKARGVNFDVIQGERLANASSAVCEMTAYQRAASVQTPSCSPMRSLS